MNMYEDEHGEFIQCVVKPLALAMGSVKWAAEIDDSLHQQIYKEIKKFPISIVLCYIFYLHASPWFVLDKICL